MSWITPEQLIIAAKQGSVATIREWWQSEPGIHVDMIMGPDESPLLHIACGRGNLDVMNYLVRTCHATVDIKNNDGNTTLIYAIKMRNMDAIKCLVESCCADVNAKDSMGYTPLHCAATHRQLHIVKYLVELGKADITVCNNDNQTPWQVAKLTDSNPCTEYLSTCSQQTESKKVEAIRAKEALLQLSHRNIDHHKVCALKNSTMADLTFLAGRDDQQQAIKACSAVLLTSVPSIEALLNESIQNQAETGDAPTTVNTGTDTQCTISLPDCNPTHVRCVLQYIYSGDASCLDGDNMTNADDLQQLVVVACRFRCWQLKIIVEAKLVDEHLSQDTLVDLLLFANQYNCMILKEEAMKMAAKDTNALVDDPQFFKLAGCADLMKEIHLARKSIKPIGTHNDEYDSMSLMELYTFLNECKDVHLESDMDRSALLDLVRKAAAAKK